MAPATTTTACSVLRFAVDEAAPPETLHVVRLQRLRLRQAAESCLDAIAEEDDHHAGTSSSRSGGEDDNIPAGSPSAHSSRATVDLPQSRRRRR